MDTFQMISSPALNSSLPPLPLSPDQTYDISPIIEYNDMLINIPETSSLDIWAGNTNLSNLSNLSNISIPNIPLSNLSPSPTQSPSHSPSQNLSNLPHHTQGDSHQINHNLNIPSSDSSLSTLNYPSSLCNCQYKNTYLDHTHMNVDLNQCHCPIKYRTRSSIHHEGRPVSFLSSVSLSFFPSSYRWCACCCEKCPHSIPLKNEIQCTCSCKPPKTVLYCNCHSCILLRDCFYNTIANNNKNNHFSNSSSYNYLSYSTQHKKPGRPPKPISNSSHNSMFPSSPKRPRGRPRRNNLLFHKKSKKRYYKLISSSSSSSYFTFSSLCLYLQRVYPLYHLSPKSTSSPLSIRLKRKGFSPKFCFNNFSYCISSIDYPFIHLRCLSRSPLSSLYSLSSHSTLFTYASSFLCPLISMPEIYFDIIKKPLSFDQILANVVRGYYDQPSAKIKQILKLILIDVITVIENALIYLQSSNPAYSAGPLSSLYHFYLSLSTPISYLSLALTIYEFIPQLLEAIPSIHRPPFTFHISPKFLHSTYIYIRALNIDSYHHNHQTLSSQFYMMTHQHRKSIFSKSPENIDQIVVHRLARRNGIPPLWYPSSWCRNSYRDSKYLQQYYSYGNV